MNVDQAIAYFTTVAARARSAPPPGQDSLVVAANTAAEAARRIERQKGHRVVITARTGGMSAILHGSSIDTADLDTVLPQAAADQASTLHEEIADDAVRAIQDWTQQ